jgi:hypothetical protein
LWPPSPTTHVAAPAALWVGPTRLARSHAARARTPHDPAVTGPAAGGRCLGKVSLLLGQMDHLEGAGTCAHQRHRDRSRAGRKSDADARGVRGPGAQL